MVIEGVIHMPDGPTPDESYAVPVIAIEDNGQLAFVHPGAKKASAPFGEFYIGERVKVIGSFVGNHSCKSNSDKECSLLHIRDQEFVPDIIVMPVDGETIVHQI
ncbi:hypothetical protein SAMN05216338_1001324 [Bradyrhizobium sp. Rc2d]|nr:hypothetical protein SAMN05216338_1001324 [Bradyrhizobium sp. Rc2d]